MARNKEQKRWTEAGFVIRLASGKKRFQVDWGTVGGVRHRERFESLGAARNACVAKRSEQINKGTEAAAIPDQDRLDAVTARRLLGKTRILDAVEFYLRHHETGAAGTMTVDALAAEFLQAPGRRGNTPRKRRARTLQDLGSRLKAFQATFGARMAADITHREITAWLDAGGWSGLNVRNYWSAVRALYRYAIRKDYMKINPVEKVEIAIDEDEIRKPRILSVPKVEALFRAATKHDPELLPRLALSYFGGLRSAEIERLDYAAVNMASGLIALDRSVTKTRKERNVTITDNLRAWLMAARSRKGLVWGKPSWDFHHRLADVAKSAGVTVPSNAGRHCFASYHFALHADKAKTAGELGHDRPDLLETTYKEIRTPDGKPITAAMAAEYFAIRPKGKAEVIPIPFEAAGA